jgi:hypothetical protein
MRRKAWRSATANPKGGIQDGKHAGVSPQSGFSKAGARAQAGAGDRGGWRFDALGVLERELLVHYGLKNGDFLVDAGCGCGRLSSALSPWPNLKYLGIDVVAELLAEAGN